jgi:hypothetical protein
MLPIHSAINRGVLPRCHAASGPAPWEEEIAGLLWRGSQITSTACRVVSVSLEPHRSARLRLSCSSRNDAWKFVSLIKKPFEEVRLLGSIDGGKERDIVGEAHANSLSTMEMLQAYHSTAFR